MKARAFLTTFCLLCAAFGQAKTAGTKSINIETPQGTMQLIPLADNAIRVCLTQPGIQPLEDIIYTTHTPTPRYKVRRTKQGTELSTSQLRAVWDNSTGAICFYNRQGALLLQEVPGGRSIQRGQTRGVPTLDVQQTFRSPADECLFGTGQFQDGYLNLRGLTRRLTQVNTQISIPFLLSSKGYGLLWNNYGLTDLNPSDQTIPLQPADAAGETYEVTATSTHGGIREQRVSDTFCTTIEVKEGGDYALLLDCGQRMSRRQYIDIDGQVLCNQNNTWLPPTTSLIAQLSKGEHRITVKGVRGDRPTLGIRRVTDRTTLHSPVAQALDYTVFAGGADQVVASYRLLTGQAPLMPEWMLGYVHCRERYNTQAELLENARRFRQKQIPADVIVQDWQYWGKYGWNAMRFDDDRYPDPKQMMDELHQMDFRLMLSVWSKVDVNSQLGRQMGAKGYYLPGCDWVDFFNPEAAQFYWTNFRDSLYRKYHIDAWWLDATEPENDDLQGRMVAGGTLPGELVRNIYPMKVVGTVYEGLRQEAPNDVPVILTRCGFAGLQRYNAVTWSGDVGNDMETLRRQIVAGLNYTACGLPWWTYDAGGFFRPGNQYADPTYKEMMLRWIECSVFLPIMRVHGYMSNTEPWNYDAETERIFTDCIKLRYQLKPYLKECARRVAEEGYTLMRALVFDFPTDREALRQQTEFMCGPKYLVCPVTAVGVSTWRVYLPENKGGWDDFYTHQHYDGGQYINVPVSISKIPVFERRGKE